MIELPIVERRRTKGTLILIYLALTLFLLLFVSIFIDSYEKPPHYLSMSIGLLLLCCGLIFTLRSYRVEEFIRIGNFQITHEGIRITMNNQETVYSKNEIKQITFRMNDTADDSIISANLSAFMSKEGIDNEIEIIDENDKKITCKVFIKDNKWLRLIDQALISWSDKNLVKIKRKRVSAKLSD